MESARHDAQPLGVGRIGGERADGHRVGVEAIVLDVNRRPRLACVTCPPVDGPDLSPSHSSGQVETASTNA